MTTATLTDLLDALANGDAEFLIAVGLDDLYPTSYDPETGVLVESLNN